MQCPGRARTRVNAMAPERDERRRQRTGGFPPGSRLLDSRDFRRVMRGGRRRSNRDLVVVAKPFDDSEFSKQVLQNSGLDVGHRSRLGITVSRKAGNAVCRNRFKRRVRDWFRHSRAEFDQELELIVIARKSGAQLAMPELDRSLRGLLGLALPERQTHSRGSRAAARSRETP